MSANVDTFQIASRPQRLRRHNVSVSRSTAMAATARPTSGVGDEAQYLEVLEQAIAREEISGTITLGTTKRTHASWLDDVYSLVARSKADEAADILFSRMDEMFSHGEFDLSDGVLRALDLSRLDPNLLVAVLSITKPASTRLSARHQLVLCVERELKKRVPERAERLLRNLR